MNKRKTWNCLIELTQIGTKEDWQALRQIVAEARGTALLAGVLQKQYVRLEVYVPGAHFIGDHAPQWDREVVELDTFTGEWRMME